LAGDVARNLYDWFGQQPPVEEDVTSARPDEMDLSGESAFPNLEFYLPYLYGSTVSLLDYLPDDTLIVIEDWGGLADSFADLEQQAISQREEKHETNQIPPDYPLPYVTWDEAQETLSERNPLHLGGTALGEKTEKDKTGEAGAVLGEMFAPGPRYGGQLRTLLDALNTFEQVGDQVVVVSNQALRLAELWAEQGHADTSPVRRLTAPPDTLMFVEGALAEG
jgi:transcription-repair coupling factor (superfamily II helicase)